MVRKPQPGKKPSGREGVTTTAARISGRYTIVATAIGAVLSAVITAVLTNGFGLLPARQHSSPSAVLPSPSAAPLPTALASGTGLSVLSSTFFLVGVDTAFVTKTTFKPTGQIAATIVNAESPAYLTIFRNAGAINEGSTALRLVFTAESAQGVRILDIAPIIVKRGAPWHGDLFAFYPQGVQPTVQTNLNLDKIFPAVLDSASGKPYFEENTIMLKQGDQEVVIIEVTASRGYVAYELKVDYLVGARERSLTISDHGKPFELSAANCPQRNVWSYGAVYLGPIAKVTGLPHPSHFPATCSPN